LRLKGRRSPGGGRSEESAEAVVAASSAGTEGEEASHRPGTSQEALRRVKQNGGSPGIDGMTVEEWPAWLVTGWAEVREQLLSGTYQPQPVREQQIPKSGGGVRQLGIPTVLDRLIQQCLLQVLQPGFDAGFSLHSYGLRPGRSAHDAVCAAQRFIQEGRRVVVDVNLEKFFDRLNHDVRMGRRAKRLGTSGCWD